GETSQVVSTTAKDGGPLGPDGTPSLNQSGAAHSDSTLHKNAAETFALGQTEQDDTRYAVPGPITDFELAGRGQEDYTASGGSTLDADTGPGALLSYWPDGPAQEHDTVTSSFRRHGNAAFVAHETGQTGADPSNLGGGPIFVVTGLQVHL